MEKKSVKPTKIIKEKTIIYKPAKTNYPNTSKPKSPNSREIQLALIENFVNMQRVLANLSIKFDGLSDNISKLLQLFELSAKSFIKKQESGVGEVPRDDRDLIRKLDTLLEQNKTIAKGLTLIEEKIRHRVLPSSEEEIAEHEIGGRPQHRPRPLPRI